MNSSELKKEARLQLSGHWLKILEVLLVYVIIITSLQLIINIIQINNFTSIFLWNFC